nr:hypothetical protein [Pontibacillus marinus]
MNFYLREVKSLKKINCFQCKHFYTTWNPQFPRGCKVYGFKTKELPSALVLKSSGSPCLAFESNQPSTPTRKQSISSFDIKL